MSTLLLRLAAPLQAWGINSKFDIRKTEREPSKSGVIGLLAAALGRRRDESLDDLIALKFGVRCDKEGKLLRDYQTTFEEENVKKVKIKKIYYKNAITDYKLEGTEYRYKNSMMKGTDHTRLIIRYYLADAIFLVGLESQDETFLKTLDQALQAPVFPLFLGRRSCPPTLPLSLGIRQTDLLTALQEEPWQVSQWEQERIKRKHDSYTMRIVTDALEQEAYPVYQKDLPESFNPMFRKYGYRMVKEHKPFQVTFQNAEDRFHTEHDPMKELR